MSEYITIQLTGDETEVLGRLVMERMEVLASQSASQERDSEMRTEYAFTRKMLPHVTAKATEDRSRLN